MLKCSNAQIDKLSSENYFLIELEMPLIKLFISFLPTKSHKGLQVSLTNLKIKLNGKL